MSKLHNDLINEVEGSETAEESIQSLLLGIAERIEACNGDKVKLSDLRSILREDPKKISDAVLANTGLNSTKTRSTPYDAPSPAFEKPREEVREGMVNTTNDHRDQVSPETDRTDAERERIEREETAKARGQAVVVEEKLPA